jgi:hypothetical protein
MAVLLREVVAVAVDDVLEVHANRQRWDSVPVGADLLASGKPAVWWHKQTECRQLVRIRYRLGARPQHRRQTPCLIVKPGLRPFSLPKSS